MTEFEGEFKAPTGFTIGTELTEDEGFGEFIAEIRKDTWEPGNDGPQYALGIKPLSFEVQGKTGMFHHWYKPSAHPRSKMGMLLAGFQGAGYDPTIPLGEGRLVGTVGWFIRKTIVFGKDKVTKQPIQSEGVIIPTRLATQAEIDAANAVGAAADTETPSPSDLHWTAENMEAVSELIDGKTRKEIQLATVRSSLPPEFKAALLKGTAIDYLQEEGAITIDSDGRIHSELLATA
jgi:hypothetical protein